MPITQKVFKGEFTEVDLSRRVAYGWAYVCKKDGSVVQDHSGDVWDITEVEKTAHDFVCNCRVGGESHIAKGGAELVESMVFSETLQKALNIDLGCEGWLVGFRINDDDLLKKVQKGTLSMFSIGGSGVRETIDE